jgi:hypothetical protein
MVCPDSFKKAKEVWDPTESPSGKYSAHAMCVVGYDDDKYSGAFEIQNSWGTGWGTGGYIWIRYSDFGRFAYEAYEIVDNMVIYGGRVDFSGSVRTEMYGSGRDMPVRFDSIQGYYRTVETYTAGTEFRYLMEMNNPAYVYAFAADDVHDFTYQVFPPEGSNISPILDYGKSIVAWPGEYTWITMDDTPGNDYLIVLYSKKALDIRTIRDRFIREKGSVSARVAGAVGADFVPPRSAQYEASEMRFSASLTNLNAVMGLILAIGKQ